MPNIALGVPSMNMAKQRIMKKFSINISCLYYKLKQTNNYTGVMLYLSENKNRTNIIT